MRILVVGGNPEGSRKKALRTLVPKALQAMRASAVLTQGIGTVQSVAEDYAKDAKLEHIQYVQRVGHQEPIDIVAWQIAKHGKADLAIGFWPTPLQRQLLEELAALGVQVVSSAAPGKAFAPL